MVKTKKVVIEMTRTEEDLLVRLAKKGDKAALRRIFEKYLEPIKAAHTYSPIGKYPAKLGYNHNPNGLDFEEHGQPLYKIHERAVELYDFEKQHKTAKLPYLKYLLDTINHRAKVMAESEIKNSGPTTTS